MDGGTCGLLVQPLCYILIFFFSLIIKKNIIMWPNGTKASCFDYYGEIWDDFLSPRINKENEICNVIDYV